MTEHREPGSNLAQWVGRLENAYAQQVAIAPLTVSGEDLSVVDAYAIQKMWVAHKISQGDRIIGHKIGLTSAPMQKMLGVDQPDFGHLLRSMAVGSVVNFPLIQPRVEPEFAFVLRRQIVGTHVSVEDVLNATAHVVPALEIIDSRIRDWKIRFVDTVADNASSGCFVLGPMSCSVHASHLTTAGMTLRRNGRVIQTGAGAAVLGHPALAVAWLARSLAEFDESLQPGEIILSGSVTAAIDVEPGDHISASLGGWGFVEAFFPSKPVAKLL